MHRIRRRLVHKVDGPCVFLKSRLGSNGEEDNVRDEGVGVGGSTPELTRGNRKSQFYEFTGELMSEVNFNFLSRSQWLQQPNSTARRRI